MNTFELGSTFVVLNPALDATTVKVGPTLYDDLDRDFGGFRGCVLFSEYSFSEDWPTWECHPKGDELLYLVQGHVQLRLLFGEEERVIELRTPGQAMIVPRNTWHTASVIQPTRMIFMTPGEGTQNVVDPRSRNG